MQPRGGSGITAQEVHAGATSAVSNYEKGVSREKDRGIHGYQRLGDMGMLFSCAKLTLVDFLYPGSTRKRRGWIPRLEIRREYSTPCFMESGFY